MDSTFLVALMQAVAGAFANMVGSALVSSIILAAPPMLVLFATLVGGVSGALGGPIALALLVSIWKVFPETRPARCSVRERTTGG